MKLLSAAAFAFLFPSSLALTAEEIGCAGEGPAVGEAISTLEEAGFQAAIQTLIIDPEIPITITNEANYRLRIVAPGELSFNSFLMRAEFSQPDIDSVVLNPDFALTPVSENAMVNTACIGNILGLVNVDTEPKEEVEGTFRLDEIGNFVLDLTVAVVDEEGNENIYYSHYDLTSVTDLPDIPTVTPQHLTMSPAPTLANSTNSSSLPETTMAGPEATTGSAPTDTTTTTTDGSTPVDTPMTTDSGSSGAAPVDAESTTTAGGDDAEEETSQSPAMLSTMVISAAMLLGVALL